MNDGNCHLRDDELLLLADGELSSRRAGRARRHLAACWHCCARLAEFESTISEFVRAARDGDSVIPPAAAPRSLLKARLARLSAPLDPRAWWQMHFTFPWREFSQAFAILLLLVLAARAFYIRTAGRLPRIPQDSLAGLLPNPSLTPGYIRPATLAKLCSMNYEEVVGTVPAALERSVFEEYGMPEASASDYEVDYLITPGLGGSDNIQNLWPEPHASGVGNSHVVWNSYVKDQLEERLHSMVCAGELDLSTAQQEIATNWISAYKKYFHTANPLPQTAWQSSISLSAFDQMNSSHLQFIFAVATPNSAVGAANSSERTLNSAVRASISPREPPISQWEPPTSVGGAAL